MEWEERISLEESLDRMNTIEELQWKQKAGKNWILHRDANTQFFHQFVNGRRRKKTITLLESKGGEIRGQNAISSHIVDFYKGLFGRNDPCSMSLNSNFWSVEFLVSEGDKLNLIKPFAMEEIKKVVMGMKENSAPRPNGYGVVFFKRFWEFLKDDMGAMFGDLYKGDLDVKSLNYGVITLVPKLKEANNIKHFRPICLLNVDFKCITKVLTNMLVPVARSIIGKNQTGFVKGRNILEGVVVLHELRVSKKNSLILKLYFEKAYGRVWWSFLEQVMRGRGFPEVWIS